MIVLVLETNNKIDSATQAGVWSYIRWGSNLTEKNGIDIEVRIINNVSVIPIIKKRNRVYGEEGVIVYPRVPRVGL